MTKIIDLSITISPKINEPFSTEIKYENHKEGAAFFEKIVGGNYLPEIMMHGGLGPAAETITLNAHSGTHIDAPWHYAPVSEGKKARTIEELPLEWFFNDGVVLDFSNKKTGYRISELDVKNKLDEIGYSLKPLDIVLIRTGTDKYLYEKNYTSLHPGMSAEATRWLCQQGIKVMGIDAWGWDIPLGLQAEEFKKDPRLGILWEAHYVGIEHEYCQIEKLAQLNLLPNYGFKIACFPVKIEHASAGWSRVVAIID